MARRADLDRTQRATLLREHLLAGHLIDRAGMPLLLGHVDRKTMTAVAIEEWRGASPVYTRRMQRLLGFAGDDVTTIFKGMQLDIGAPPQFLDFRYRVHDRDHGEFWLDHCGALADVEPMGEEFVHAMCHEIEDPTFPATACASNPRARVEPIHRPPRRPADRHPHCHWRVTIDPAGPAASEPGEATALAASAAARMALPSTAVGDGDGDGDAGRRDYAGPLEADLDLEAFEAEVQDAIDDEVCLQGHLLVVSFLAAVERRLGPEVAATIGRGQLAGVGGAVAGRLAAAFAAGDDLGRIATVLELHPVLLPVAYTGASVRRDGGCVRVELARAPALGEQPAPSWIDLLVDGGDGGDGGDRALDAIVQGVTPTARCRRVPGGPAAAWEVTVGHEPAPESPEVAVTRFSTGVSFVFVARP